MAVRRWIRGFLRDPYVPLVNGAEGFGRCNDSFTITSPDVADGQPGHVRFLVTLTGGLSTTSGTADVALNYQFGPSIYSMFYSQTAGPGGLPGVSAIDDAGISGFQCAPGSRLGVQSLPGPGLRDRGVGHGGQPVPSIVVVAASGTIYGSGGVSAVNESPGPGARDTVRLTAVPNPTTGGAQLFFTLPAGATGSCAVFDLAGRLVRSVPTARTSFAEAQSAWWDGRDDAGRTVPPGIYFARMTWGGSRRTVRISVVH